MLQVPATFQINRVEQYREFYKESLKMCREHNEAKLICCFSLRKQMLHKEAKRRWARKIQLCSKWVSPWTAAVLRHCFHIKKEENLGAVF